ncbi:hypothetical protein [Silvimonas iriomotensis]|uniref:PXPV repeat-containing protein n=1 Tax=Silvimonas iriomotensis TaxID=449662 RepID=A0ABQ2P4U0_9NEIS|nr:hypothetical protein [Silvimonas iriomotensis]GGP18101.1 hypothetical protein GCM10010970_03170 [Silvimonas iriomotensis]
MAKAVFILAASTLLAANWAWAEEVIVVQQPAPVYAPAPAPVLPAGGAFMGMAVGAAIANNNDDVDINVNRSTNIQRDQVQHYNRDNSINSTRNSDRPRRQGRNR